MATEEAFHELYNLLPEETRLQLLRDALADDPTMAAAADGPLGTTGAHSAAAGGRTAELRVWLEAAPGTAQAVDVLNHTPLHYAALKGHAASVQLLLEVAPQTALVYAGASGLPVSAAAHQGHLGVARQLLAAAEYPLGQLLANLDGHAEQQALPLFADVAMRWALAPAQWRCVPSPCPGLARALPAVLARSEAEARLLVAHLTRRRRRRLRTFARCLVRVQRRLGLVLPPALVQRMLALSMAE